MDTEAWVDVKGRLHQVEGFRTLTGEYDGLLLVSLTDVDGRYAGVEMVLAEDVFIGYGIKPRIDAANWADAKREQVWAR